MGKHHIHTELHRQLRDKPGVLSAFLPKTVIKMTDRQITPTALHQSV